MKYCLIFNCDESISLPEQHNHILQAAILDWLQDRGYTDFLHNEGYVREKRTFKLFTFSNIMGESHYDKKTKKIIFEGEIAVFLSSYMDEMEEFVLKSIEEGRGLRFGGKVARFVNAYQANEKYEACVVETVSPITIHSTFELPSGKKKTYYYEPYEEDFSTMLKANLVRKFEAVHGYKPKDDSFSIVPKRGAKCKKCVMRYRDTIIIGWKGLFIINGSEEMLKLAMTAGVGARNSIGMGCVLSLKENGKVAVDIDGKY